MNQLSMLIFAFQTFNKYVWENLRVSFPDNPISIYDSDLLDLKI